MQRHPFVTASGTRSTPRGLVPAGLIAALLHAGPALAQSFLGTVRATVSDPQGAPVPMATVLILDEATGVPRSVETDAEGRYEAPNLRPGTYRVEVELASFKKFVRAGLVLKASGTARADVK